MVRVRCVCLFFEDEFSKVPSKLGAKYHVSVEITCVHHNNTVSDYSN